MTTWLDSIDVDNYVRGLIKKEAEVIDQRTKPTLNLLSDSRDSYKVRVSAYGSLRSQLTDTSSPNSLYNIIDNLKSAFDATYQVTPSNSAIVTASATSGAQLVPGSHSIAVTQLAQAQTLGTNLSSPPTSKDTAMSVTESLTFSVAGKTFAINVTAANSLQDICDNINNTNEATVGANLIASIVQLNGGGYQLLVSATQSGADNAISITESGAHPLGLDTIIDAASGGASIIRAAKNATFTYDDISMQSTTNSNIIQGVSYNLLSLGTTTVNIVGTNSEVNATAALEKFVSTYNDIMSTIAKAQITGLTYDPNLNAIADTLKATVDSVYSGGGDFSLLADVGIMPKGKSDSLTATVNIRDSEGNLSTKEVKYHVKGLLQINNDEEQGVQLSTALSNNFAGVQAALLGGNGILTKLKDALKTAENGVPGAVDKLISESGSRLETSLTTVTKNIDEKTSAIEKQKKELPQKYAMLDVTLLRLQFTGRFLSQQIESFNK